MRQKIIGEKWFFILVSLLIFMSFVLIFPLHGSSSLHVVSNEIDLVAGSREFVYYVLPNEKGHSVIITDVVHSGVPDLDGITMSVYSVEKEGSNEIPGEELDFPITIGSDESLDFFICYEIDIAMKPDVYTFESRFVMEPFADEDAPNVVISQPERNSLYVWNHKVHNNFNYGTLIIGDIIIMADVDDESGISQVEFFIDDELMISVEDEPFLFHWDDRCFGMYTITVDAYDTAGNVASDSIRVFKLY